MIRSEKNINKKIPKKIILKLKMLYQTSNPLEVKKNQPKVTKKIRIIKKKELS